MSSIPRLSRGDLLLDAARTIRSRPGRALALGLAVALGVAAYVGILSMSSSANRQAAERIDRLRPELVTISPTGSAQDQPDLFQTLRADHLLAGGHTRSASVTDRYRSSAVVARIGSTPISSTIIGADGNLMNATRSRFTGEALPGAGLLRNAHVAMVGAGVAERLGLADPDSSPTIWIAGIPFTVTGVVADSTYLTDLIDSVVIPRSTANALNPGGALSTVAYVRTPRGDANQVADELPLRLTPQSPEAWSVDVPQVPIDVSTSISADLRNLTLAVSALVMAIGVVAIANAMMRSVYERTSEIGLRRSLGARAAHIVSMVVLEAAIVGLSAGLIGVLLGCVAAVAIAGHDGWPVAIEPRSVAQAIVAATAAGIIAGLIPGLTAVRVTPSQALRRD